MFVDPKAIDYFTNEVVLVKINGDSLPALKESFSVSGYPTSILINSDRSEIDRIIGYAPTDEFLKIITDYRNGIGTLDDLLGKAKDNVDRALYFEIADKYKYRGAPEDAELWFGKVIEAGEPTDSLSGESKLAVANMIYRAKDYDDAITRYKAIAVEFDGMPAAETADIYVAYITQKKGDSTSAIGLYEMFLKKYPESEDASWAQKQIDKLKAEKDEEESGD